MSRMIRALPLQMQEVKRMPISRLRKGSRSFSAFELPMHQIMSLPRAFWTRTVGLVARMD
ncbi:hypothetical protein WK72_15300 [Burkholderia ubonensis]|nr:hypothetical protein WK72_15300 [Burkholderia ubonensis]